MAGCSCLENRAMASSSFGGDTSQRSKTVRPWIASSKTGVQVNTTSAVYIIATWSFFQTVAHCKRTDGKETGVGEICWTLEAWWAWELQPLNRAVFEGCDGIDMEMWWPSPDTCNDKTWLSYFRPLFVRLFQCIWSLLITSTSHIYISGLNEFYLKGITAHKK